jgi:hypothetical protein
MSMTITYCDFCGEVIPPESGDRVNLGEPESYPEGFLDACSKCFEALWALVRNKNLRPKEEPCPTSSSETAMA